jgi:hypothetical protein
MSVGHSRGGAGPGPSTAASNSAHAAASTKKRPRHSLEEAFVRPDAEEKRRLGTGYQTMQSQAEGSSGAGVGYGEGFRDPGGLRRGDGKDDAVEMGGCID